MYALILYAESAGRLAPDKIDKLKVAERLPFSADSDIYIHPKE